MVLNITCQGSCRFINNTETCTSFPGCEWYLPSPNTTEHVVAPGYCGPNSAQTYGSTGWIGVFLALLGGVFINIGMNSMKHAHNINTDETGKPIKHFARIPFWWVGVLGLVGGEAGNLIAYGYAPAAVVTPMGAIGVVANVFITSTFLKEYVSKVNVFGVLCIVIGIVIVVYFSPHTTIIISSATFFEDVVQTTECIVYLCIVAVGTIIMVPTARKYGHKHVVIFVLTCSVIASLTIVSAKAFSSLLSEAFVSGFEKDWLSPWPYILLVVLVGTAVFSMAYINSAMIIFGNSQVVPTYYALFTTTSVASAAFVYKEFSCMADPLQTGLFVFGIVVAMFGVFLVQYGKAPEDAPGLSRSPSQAALSGATSGVLGNTSSKVADIEEGLPSPKDKGPTLREATTVVEFTQKDTINHAAWSSAGPETSLADEGKGSVEQEPPKGVHAQVGVVVESWQLPGSVGGDAKEVESSVQNPPRKRLGTLRPLPVKKGRLPKDKDAKEEDGSPAEPAPPRGGGMD